MAGAAGQAQHVLGGGGPLDRGGPGPRAHDVGGGLLTEAQRPGHQAGRADVERPGLRRAPHQGGELLRGAGAGELLLRGDAQAPEHQVGRAVEHDDQGLGDDREDPHRHGHDLGRRQRRRDAEELRQQLAQDHREQGGDEQGQGGRDRLERLVLQAERAERRLQQPAEAGRGDVAEDQGGQRDADLGGRELGRQAPQRPEHDLRPAVPGVDGLLDGGAVQGDQRELRGHEEGGASSQSDAGKDE